MEKYGKDVYHFGSSFIQCILPYNILDKAKQNIIQGKSNGNVISTSNEAENEYRNGQNDVESEGDAKNDARNDVKNDAKKASVNKETLEEKVIGFVRDNPLITRVEMAERAGVFRPTIERMLKKSKRIKHVGPKKGGHGEVIE